MLLIYSIAKHKAYSLHMLHCLFYFTGADPNYYAAIPHNRLPSERYHKSPHALWGTMVLPPDIGGQSSDASVDNVHPLLVAARSNTLVAQPKLLEKVLIIDTDMRKQQASEQLTTAMHPHRLPGLSIISGIGLVDTVDGDISDSSSQSPMPAQWSQILSTASFATPPSPLLLFLLHDPYPTAPIRKAMHSLFLSLFVDARFKSRFAAALGGVAYRPLSTLFCSGVGTESDSPLAMSVQIFTAGSLVRALGNSSSVAKLLCSDSEDLDSAAMARNVKSIPVAHNVVRCIQTNLLGSTQEVERALQNVNNGETVDSSGAGLIVNPALIYKAGEHPMATLLPAAPDDGFLDSRSTKHKRLPHLLRDLEYIFETPSTAMRLLLTAAATASTSDAHHMPLSDIPHIDPSTYLTFPTIWARLLRLGQGMDPQKRLISGGHVEYEKNRWLEAFGLSLNLAGAYDALAESPAMTDSNIENIRRGMGNLISSLLKEIKLWLYREGMLETGEPISSSASENLGQQEALQRSTLHLNSTQMGITSEDGLSSNGAIGSTPAVATIALSCATSVKMTEAQLELLELALKREAEPVASSKGGTVRAAVMGDSLRCPHTPLNGDCISFHLPLHRALARSIRSICSVTVSHTKRDADPRGWWKLPVLDDEASDEKKLPHALASLIRPTIRSSNCRVVWAAGPECSSPEAHTRRSRSRFVSASIAAAKVIHSLCDHPLRCLVASQQIERHLWARNGSAAAGMALNYGSMPLCRSFRDLDLALVQFSAAGLSVGLGARRVFSLMLSRFSLDGYLCDLERRGGGFSPTGSIGSGGSPRRASSAWVNPPRMQDPDHAVALMECFFSTICVLVTELPSPAPTSSTDITALRCNMKRELLHALAAEPRSHSEAMAAVSGAVTRRDDFDGGDADSATSFRAIFAQVLKEVGNVKSLGSRSTGAPSYELKAEVSDEYDPNFFHLRRHEHQHAMDTISRLRRHKVSPPGPPGSPRGGGYAKCLPLVTPPPSAHPRFIACRLLLHLPAIDGSVRRGLMFALFGGKWLPPDEPLSEMDSDGDFFPAKGPGENAMDVISPTMSTESTYRAGSPPRRSYVRSPSSSKRSKRSSEQAEHFSTETVAASSISLLEILQILTLQAHTLEECASLHLSHALDVESRDLSSGLSLNSYLNRLVHMPERLEDIWALRKAPNGPLPSKGSGANRGSILGLLIALYENRADNSSGNQGGDRDEGNGGARSLAADGLKWLLRLVDSIADGAPSVGAASERASSGARHRSTTTLLIDTSTSESIIDPNIRDLVSGMLANLADLWPKEENKNGSGTGEAGGMSAKAREARKAAQRRAMERMMKAQSSFAASLNGDTSNDVAAVDAEDDEEANLCIICRCDDKDGEMGPLGFLGHVQRTRALQLRATSEASHSVESDENMLHRTFRVIGDRGCQLRASEAMNSKAIACLPIGSIVTVLESKVSPKYDLLSRRVLVRHVDAASNSTTEGWASLQSSQGYIILSPLSTLCYTNSRWGCTRPIVLQCGHAAHLRCVEAHCLSLHQRAAGDQPYDGRFAANIDDGEFLCPLCKQLSNILVPDIGNCGASRASSSVSSPLSSDGSGRFTPPQATVLSPSTNSISSIRNLLCTSSHTDYEGATEDDDKMTTSLKQFGAHLYTAMQIPWDKSSPVNRRQQKNWHPALMRWDFEEDNDDYTFSNSDGNEPCVGDILRMLRELHVAWAAVGHTSAATEAAFRGVDGVEDPWSDYSKSTRDSNPDVLSLSRTVTATSGLLEVLSYELGQKLGGDTYKARKMTVTLIGGLLADILEGRFWTVGAMPSSPQSAKQQSIFGQWQSITGLLASTPCHVARDGMLAQRHEARATAVAMWTTKGFGFPPAGKKDQEAPAISTSTPSDSTLPSSAAAVTSEESEGGAEGTGIEIRERSPDVPTPLAVHRVCADQETKKSLDSSWGTMDPFKASEPISIKKDNIEVQLSSGTQTFDPSLPFRPAVASAYLYIPLLAWDMSTFAGAIYSSMLVNKEAGSQASNDDLLHASRLMLIGRLIQILVSPGGFDPLREIDSGDLEAVMAKDEFEKHWQKEDILREAKSLAELLKYCRNIASPGSNQQGIEVATEAEAAQLLHNVGLAILPFARTSVLLLRSSASILRQREKKDRREKKSKLEKPTATENIFSTLLENSETMAFEDGFRILKSIGAPLPSELMKDISSHDVSGSPSSWFALIKRWLSSVRGFEAYHGSRGKGLVFDPLSGAWQQSAQQTEATDTSGSNEKESKRFIVQEHISRSGSTDVSTEGTMGVEIAVAPENEGGDNGIPYNGSMEMEDAMDPTERGDNFMNQGDDDSESLGSDVNVDMLDIDFDEELEEMEAVEMPGQMDPGGGGNNLASAYTLNEMSGDISDDDRSYNSSESDPVGVLLDRRFANLETSAVIPFQPSMLGVEGVGPGPRGTPFDFSVASSVMSDRSHLGMVHRVGSAGSGFIRLPHSFIELYSLVNRVKGRETSGSAAMDDADDGSSAETAICLLTGAIISAGSSRRQYSRSYRPPGACTLHSRRIGSGVGIYFLVQKCTVLLVHNNKSAYSASLFVDEHGEEDPGLRRGRPLFMKEERYAALETLWRQHGIPREVAQIRSTADRVIRDNWY